MTVTAEGFASWMDAIAGLRPADESPFAALTTVPQVLGFAYTSVLRDGGDVETALDRAEMLARSTCCTPDQVRRYAKVLAWIGYGELADRLREIAGRRKHSLRPLSPG